jgi:hypothetical protein
VGGDSYNEAKASALRAFEIASSEFAVSLLTDCGYPNVLDSYTNFMRADLEAMTEFHWTGKAPVWRRFFAKWNDQVAAGERRIEAFKPKVIPTFRPADIETQEILQQQESS